MAPVFRLWTFKPLGFDGWTALTSKPAIIIMTFLVAPCALWLTFSRLGRASGPSRKMSPDSVSSLFPDRPIRPLPKRRLRERLSPDVADTIKYPLEPQSNAPLFYYPYNLKAEAGSAGLDAPNAMIRENSLDPVHEAGLRRYGLGADRDDEGMIQRGGRPLASRPSQDAPGNVLRTPPRTGQGRRHTPQAPPSTASSADGYDSFENTNNKKKRKIPTAGDGLLNGNHVMADSGILGVPSPPTTGDGGPGDALAATPSPYPYTGVTGSPVQGISGPGRGRYGRVRNGRSPLRQVPDTNSSWPIKNSRSRSDGQYSAPLGEKTGIISNAIASAGKLPIPQGQENISLLQQQAKASPVSSQFTFTFDSQVSGTVPWPGSESPTAHMAENNHNHTSHGSYSDSYYGGNTRSTPHSQPAPPGSTSGQGGPSVSADGTAKGPAPGTGAPKKHRRRADSLARAAKQRRREQEYKNKINPPAPGDLWICEFCEYERIFGQPPVGLIRQYEEKDRQRRNAETQRRKHIEKAKNKSRKGKKPGKLPPKNNTAHDLNAAPSAGQHHASMEHEPGQETHSEDFEEEDYYEDDIHDEHCPARASGHDCGTHESGAFESTDYDDTGTAI
ncbi:hypothetical protein PFICI_10588 [Pestalotiopsis fici W106-1]|uniref:Uncharacterized protein n=1 Tax=Pestalotiopsis fici (strain W106-1 / CGMCC3.15140) TaxID=1229662 RepID=W3X052_PESFW|nr:uncharacterized protein PFICI_10588 [Pestalotiopsis fici W106-1]ETS78526.1 hypothetical protein PFICI_10588 [Pestalotiopsis fici W106-1]